jgi:ABC-type siderophore export system fused ATPase/permease subunit
MQDLTLASFAYLRTPLLVAAIAFCMGALAIWKFTGQRAFLAAALMMVLFFHAARMAMAVFDPFMSSRPLAEALSEIARWHADYRSPLLHVFFHLFLY